MIISIANRFMLLPPLLMFQQIMGIINKAIHSCCMLLENHPRERPLPSSWIPKKHKGAQKRGLTQPYLAFIPAISLRAACLRARHLSIFLDAMFSYNSTISSSHTYTA
jgi:hypothetical protein